VRIEVPTGHIRHERRNILDEGRVTGGIAMRGGERADGAAFDNGFTAAMISACSLRISGVGFAQIPATPTAPAGAK
jgi:hypothetical protein